MVYRIFLMFDLGIEYCVIYIYISISLEIERSLSNHSLPRSPFSLNQTILDTIQLSEGQVGKCKLNPIPTCLSILPYMLFHLYFVSSFLSSRDVELKSLFSWITSNIFHYGEGGINIYQSSLRQVAASFIFFAISN